jgi:5'-phosphate synthase pdxT subunit
VTPRVGVLALQGDFREHLSVIRGLGADAVPVRRTDELAAVDGLVIPGGESSVMDKLARAFGLAEPLKAAIRAGLPVYGTCAGLIMLADRVLDAIEGQESLGGLDVAVRRNAFGSQVDSFETDLAIPELGDPPVHAVFIRAPVVESLGARSPRPRSPGNRPRLPCAPDLQ